MKEPDVSVVTVVCNGVAHVGETIESVLAQSGVDLEYWVIDGGSTDGTVEVVGKYAARLTGWTSEPDQGIADAFNKGLARVRGEYVMFLNADDALANPDALEQLVAFARADLPIGAEFDAIGRVDVDHLHLALESFLFG